MATFQLTNNRSLLIEPAHKKLRLIITNGQQELACRIETPGKVKSFLTSAETQLFKGRLQLHKRDEAILVMLNWEDVGIVGVEELRESL